LERSKHFVVLVELIIATALLFTVCQQLGVWQPRAGMMLTSSGHFVVAMLVLMLMLMLVEWCD
jgi:hypothetical protein